MNTRPPQPPHSLDAEERALAKTLPRLHGRTAPGPDLDASILAAAQAAVQPVTPARIVARPRIRWIAPAALAASMVLAVGMAWQLRPLPQLQATKPAAAATDDTANVRAVLMTEPAAREKPVPMKVMPPATASPTVPARQQYDALESSAPEGMSGRDDRPALMPLPPPPAPPVPPAPVFAAPAPAPAAPPASAPPTMAAKSAPSTESRAGALQPQATQARAAAPAAAANAAGMVQAATADKASVADSARPAANSPARAPPTVAGARNEAEMAADGRFVDDPEEDIPPATAASPAVRDAWLRRITQLLEQGNRQDARASLAEFKRRYPNAVLPPELKVLDSEP